MRKYKITPFAYTSANPIASLFGMFTWENGRKSSNKHKPEGWPNAINNQKLLLLLLFLFAQFDGVCLWGREVRSQKVEWHCCGYIVYWLVRIYIVRVCGSFRGEWICKNMVLIVVIWIDFCEPYGTIFYARIWSVMSLYKLLGIDRQYFVYYNSTNIYRFLLFHKPLAWKKMYSSMCLANSLGDCVTMGSNFEHES